MICIAAVTKIVNILRKKISSATWPFQSSPPSGEYTTSSFSSLANCLRTNFDRSCISRLRFLESKYIIKVCSMCLDVTYSLMAVDAEGTRDIAHPGILSCHFVCAEYQS